MERYGDPYTEKKVRDNMKTGFVIAFAVIVVVMVLCIPKLIRPYMQPAFIDVNPSETAFVIPLDASSKEQKKLESAEAYEANRVMQKRIEVPQRWVKTGRWPSNGKYMPGITVVKVDRSPVTREISAEKDKTQAIWVESADSIGFSTGFSVTAYIKEQDAAKFLYMYPSGSLASVMDQEVRARIQQVAAEIAAKDILDALRGKKQDIIDAVKKDVTSFFEGRGITVTTVGMFGGFTYENPKIQEAIDNVFIAQQEKSRELALLEAMASNKSRLEAQGVAEANKMREAAKGQADAKVLVAKAEAEAIELVVRALKEAQQTPAFIEVKRLEVQRAGVEKWNGTLPQYQGMGAVPFIELPTAK